VAYVRFHRSGCPQVMSARYSGYRNLTPGGRWPGDTSSTASWEADDKGIVFEDERRFEAMAGRAGVNGVVTPQGGGNARIAPRAGAAGRTQAFGMSGPLGSGQSGRPAGEVTRDAARRRHDPPHPPA
jgi:hypothetical protein